MTSKAPYPDECPAFEVRFPSWPYQVGAHFEGFLVTGDTDCIHAHDGTPDGFPFYDYEIRPLSRIARKMLACVKP